MEEFYNRLQIENSEAADKLVAAGYEWLEDLMAYPPSAQDLDSLGFSMLERNKILLNLSPGRRDWEEAVLAAVMVSNRLLERVLREKVNN
jgi:hypothetical protein